MSAEEGPDEGTGWPPPHDLSLVLKRLMSRESSTRRTRESRQRLANHPLTEEYLKAGLELIAEQFEASADESGDDEEPWSSPSEFLSWISVQKVIDKATSAGRQRGNQGTFNDRWPYRDYYIEDLLSYSLWSVHWSSNVSIAAKSADQLAAGIDLVSAVHEAAYLVSRVKIENPVSRFFIIAAAISDRYPELKEPLARTYREVDEQWIIIYREMLAGRNLKLRPDVTIRDLADTFSALAAGLAIHAVFDPDLDFTDDDRRQSFLGKAVLAVLAGCIDTGDGRSVTDLVQELAGRHRTGTARHD
jgi:hypothetical protein